MLVAVVIAGIGAWRRWIFLMPLAVGAGFLAVYVATGVPRFPPLDGSDWLFWAGIGVTLIGMVARVRFGWLLAGLTGVVAVLLLRPLHDVTGQVLWVTCGVFTIVGIALGWVAEVGQRRLGSFWTLAPFCVAAAGAGVVIFSSDSRTIGLHAIGLAAALGPVVVLGYRLRAAQGVAIVIVPLLAGLLLAGHFYAGVTCVNLSVLLGTPLLVLAGAFLPIKRVWVRGVIALLAVMIAVGAVTAPTALAAKKAAEADPYADVYK